MMNVFVSDEVASYVYTSDFDYLRPIRDFRLLYVLTLLHKVTVAMTMNASYHNNKKEVK